MKINLDKIKQRISLEKVNQGDIVVQNMWSTNVINASGLSDEELFCAIVLAHNTLGNDPHIYYPITKKKIKKYVDWSNYKISKVAKSISQITVMPMQDDEGHLCGRGYVVKELTNN